MGTAFSAGIFVFKALLGILLMSGLGSRRNIDVVINSQLSGHLFQCLKQTNLFVRLAVVINSQFSGRLFQCYDTTHILRSLLTLRFTNFEYRFFQSLRLLLQLFEYHLLNLY